MTRWHSAAQAPGYFTVVQSPMDITTMKNKLKANKYRTFSDLQVDVRLMFNNCRAYNAAGTLHFAEAGRLLEVSEKVFEKNRAAWVAEGGTFGAGNAGPAARAVVAAPRGAAAAFAARPVEPVARQKRPDPIMFSSPPQVLAPRRYASAFALVP